MPRIWKRKSNERWPVADSRTQYGTDQWTDLVSKKSKAAKKRLETDPTSGIMDMMKDLYDGGDDTMRRTIGEAMMKSQKARDRPDLKEDDDDAFKMPDYGADDFGDYDPLK